MLRIKLIAFALLTVVGLSYVAVRYVHVGDSLSGTYTVYADLPATGGLFANAPVSYRGVPVGRIRGVELHGDGVRAELRIDGGIRIPADLRAVVAHRSAVGEQYLDLRPADRKSVV